MFFTTDSLNRALANQPDFKQLQILPVKDPSLADLVVEIDRPVFTYQFTYSVLDSKTSIVLGSGKVTAIDGETASGPIAKAVLKVLCTAKQTATSKQQQGEN